MVKLSDLLLDKSLHGQCTGRRHSVGSLNFMTSLNMYGIVTLTIDGVTSFSQLLEVKIVRKNMRFSLNKSCGITDSQFKMAESL